MDYYSSSSSSPDSSLSHSSVTPSPISRPLRNFKHQVFPSYHGADVRKDFLSHILKEFKRKGIEPFNDNEIQRGKSIRPELIEAIRGSRIALVLLSKNYASSSWCLGELVEIMNCEKELGQTVIAVFYKVDPSDVKKLTGDFGKVFTNTCEGKKREDIETWRQAFEKVATITGYHSDSREWGNEAEMIEKIASDISKMLCLSTPSRDFDGFVGMGAHMKEIKELLHLDSNEVRMIGIWGPSGIGKTTIARYLFSKHSHDFNWSMFMENFKGDARQVRSGNYGLKLHLQQQLLSGILKQKDFETPHHLGVAEDKLKDKKVLVVLDDVDRLLQLEAMANKTRWFGPGSRIIITTQNKRVLTKHGIEHIYKVDFPTTYEAFQIFCKYAFGQNSPKDGFEELAWEVTSLAGNLPLGLEVMGSHFRRMSKMEWTKAMPRLRIQLDSDDSEIQSILKFSYDDLSVRDKGLFLHIACLFRGERKDHTLEEMLQENYPDVEQGLDVLAEKSLISIKKEYLGTREFVVMHNLLEHLGKEISRLEPGQEESIRKPGKRQFLFDANDICEVLTDNTGSGSILGIDLDLSSTKKRIDISERAFEGMSNLQFLRFRRSIYYQLLLSLHFPRGLSYLPGKLRLLQWDLFPMTTLPSEFHTEFLVKLIMPASKLEKLWDGTKLLENLRCMDLSGSEKLQEVPDLSGATNLEELDLSSCIRLRKLPSSIGDATSLVTLNLSCCWSLLELPSSIGNATSLVTLNLSRCSGLLKLPPSIGNATSLVTLNLNNCWRLVNSLPLLETFRNYPS